MRAGWGTKLGKKSSNLVDKKKKRKVESRQRGCLVKGVLKEKKVLFIRISFVQGWMDGIVIGTRKGILRSLTVSQETVK